MTSIEANYNRAVSIALTDLVKRLRKYGSFPADLLPAIQAAERALAGPGDEVLGQPYTIAGGPLPHGTVIGVSNEGDHGVREGS